MSRVQRHVLPSADLLLRLQRVCLVRDKPRRRVITFLIIILVISPVFVCRRGLNKQGYQCRRECHDPFPLTLWKSLTDSTCLNSFSLSLFVSFRVQCGYSQKMHRQSHCQMHRFSHQQQRNNGKRVPSFHVNALRQECQFFQAVTFKSGSC